jgi:hypothetical protein
MTRSTGTLALAGCNLAVAGLQLLFFLPVVEGGRALDVALWGGGPLLLRVDRLSLLFGVVWAVALAVAALVVEGNDKRWAWLVTLGLLGAAYAREPILFYTGWEVAALGIWLSAPVSARPGGQAKLAALVHGPGLALLALVAAGGVGAFVPPEGGAAQQWTLGAVLLMAVAAGGRALAPALYLGLKLDAARDSWPILALFGSTGPFLLAKALVEARWDDWGVWALALVGTAALLAVIWTGRTWPVPLGGAVATLAIIGLGVAPLSPAAAMGAVWLVGLGAFLPFVSALGENEQWSRWAMGAALAAVSVGAWMVVQGALGSHYAVTAIIALPVLTLVAAYAGVHRVADGIRTHRWVLVAALLGLTAFAVYPQAAVEWFTRSAIGAMAGGVGASSGLVSTWGLGLATKGPAELLAASLPATGIAVAAFVAWTVLYWLRGLLAAFVKRRSPSEPQ